ncbi:MAG TPA: family 65 glycosyl hydrolase [Lachnospiraceae bacterium]|nr:family 65 glycosyl hydrolase [Lachnospiraceae bacterium]
MLKYTIGKGNYKNWIIGEDEFSLSEQGKGESVFCLGNGYMGIRSAFEEPYPFQTRGTFVSGCFDRLPDETVELPNAADVCEIRLILDGEYFSMTQGEVSGYQRCLNLYTGELTRSLDWRSPGGKRYRLVFKRAVSHADVHACGMQVEICARDHDAKVQVTSGINGRMTNSGAQHFSDGSKRVLDRQFLYLDQRTVQSGIIFYHCCGSRVVGAKGEVRDFAMERRRILETMDFKAEKGKTVRYEKLAVLYTGRELAEQGEQALQLLARHVRRLVTEGYDALQEKNAACFRSFWEQRDIRIRGENDRIPLALRFAQYHLLAMIPPDSSSSIAAKGLTGEGYKGHVFWDTEVYILPYYLFTAPEKAAQLLEYRINRMGQARENAKKKGYRGLLFPWESTGTGEEETPLFAGMDILTGKAAHVWAGIKEHHITADIAYALWMYRSAAGGRDIEDEEGNLLIVGAALFWMSRSVYVEEKDRYEIRDIIGPDEYTEHVDNNAYSNYMARDTVQKALRLLRGGGGRFVRKAEAYYGETGIAERMETYARKLYLPLPVENPPGILPQNDGFLQKKTLDVAKYRSSAGKQTILKDYSRRQVDQMQVLKQPDVVMLLILLPELFDTGIKWKNWNYYEPKTIHDSSLSRAIYSVAASDCKESREAYECFLHAMDIDMGPNPHSSDQGIHAAAMGGIWLAVVRGFVGLRVLEDCLCIEPCLPEQIQEICFSFIYRGKNIALQLTKEKLMLSSTGDEETPVRIQGRDYRFTHGLEIAM